MMILLLLYPDNCLESAKQGLSLWFAAVLPSLLPFMIASFILLETGIVRLIAHVFSPITRVLFAAPGESAYVFFAATLSGYPVGAKLTADLFEKKQITEADAQQMIRFTSVSGPVFITGAVSAGMLGLSEAGVYLAISHYLSAILVGLVFGIFLKIKTNKKKTFHQTSLTDAFSRFKTDIYGCKPLGQILAISVEKSVMTLLKIGGFIVFFSVVLELLSVTGIMHVMTQGYAPIAGLTGIATESTQALLYGSVELTTGCSKAAILNIDIVSKLSVISSIIAFGGACIHMQTKAICAESGLKPKRFLLAKSLQAFFAYMLCSISLSLFPITVSATSIKVDTKTAAYFGIVFAAVSIIILLIIKTIQKNAKPKSAFSLTRKL